MEEIFYEEGKFFCESKTVHAKRITKENYSELKAKYDFLKEADISDYLVTNGETYVVEHGHFRRYYCPVDIPQLDKLIWAQMPDIYKKNHDTGVQAIEDYKVEFPELVEDLRKISG